MKVKALFSVALAGALLLSTTPVSADEVSDLQAKRSATEEKKSQLEAELGTVKTNISALEAKVQSLNVEISKNINDISMTEAKIKKVEQEIAITEQKIKDAEAELEKKKDILAENLRVMYSKGKVSYIEFLFRSDSVSDFMYRFNTLTDVAKANQALYDEIKALLEELELQKKHLDEEKTEMDKQKNDLLVLKDSLAVRQKEQLEAIAKLESQENSLHSEINDQDAAISAINNDIAKVIAEREAARQREQAARGNSNTASGNYGNEIKGTGQWIRPVDAGRYVISSPYGYRTDPVYGTQAYHSGIDFAAALGTPIHAVDNGTVLFAGPASGYGQWIVIDHNNGLYSIYGHMYANQIYVSPGQVVTKGQHIADVGNNGKSTGAHIHLSASRGFSGGKFNYIDPASLF